MSPASAGIAAPFKTPYSETCTVLMAGADVHDCKTLNSTLSVVVEVEKPNQRLVAAPLSAEHVNSTHPSAPAPTCWLDQTCTAPALPDVVLILSSLIHAPRYCTPHTSRCSILFVFVAVAFP